jgi:hypothetical protein
MMTAERKALAWLAVVGSVVACLPCALLFGLYTTWAFAVFRLTPEGYRWMFYDNPPQEFWGATALPAIFMALVALVPGIIFLVLGIRTLLRARPEQGEPTAG